jgi:hypothetical protein
MAEPGSVNVNGQPETAVSHGTDAALLGEVLHVYKPHCRYLTAATVELVNGVAVGQCEFSIPESCYIDDTGHFNAVEFNICYNQMLYYVCAKSVRERLIPAFAHWTMADYWARQLPNFYIATYQAVFKQPMSGRQPFHGEIRLLHVKQQRGAGGRQPLIWLDTSCRYWEDDGGHCLGSVGIAITNPPPSE